MREGRVRDGEILNGRNENQREKNRHEKNRQTREPNTEGRRQRCRKRRNRRRFRTWIPALGIFSLLLAAGALFLHYGEAGLLPEPLQARADILPDRRAKRGSLHENGERQVGEGDFWVILNQIPTVKAGSDECNLEYENPKANHYGARVNLYLKATGERLGGTRRVDPGRYVETIKIADGLEPGEYPVTARVELFDGSTPAGGMSMDITLHILE